MGSGQRGLCSLIAALAAGALTSRVAEGRRWYDSLTTFALLTTIFAAVFYLTAHVLAGIPVAGIEFIAWRE